MDNAGKAFFNLIGHYFLGEVPWQKTHHDVPISSSGSTTRWAICIGPCSNDRRVPDTTTGQEYDQGLNIDQYFMDMLLLIYFLIVIYKIVKASVLYCNSL